MNRAWHRYTLNGCAMVAAFSVASGLWANGVVAQTVYKSVDEKGNVIYSENPPAKSKSGKIKSTKELNIDPNQNVMPAQPPLNLPPLPTEQDAQGPAEDDLSSAKAALEEAEAKLKSGSETQPGDFVGRAGGGVGPSPQRLQRLQDLQREVDAAREQLKQAGGD